MTQIELIDELRGTRCRCGKVKKARQTFCSGCYYSLPRQMQQALYRGVGDGYEEAYEAAVERMEAKA